jgi:multidrug efflux system membrane fusion protein
MKISLMSKAAYFIGLLSFTSFCLIGCSEKPQEVKQVIRPVKTMIVGGASREFQRTFTASVRASDRVELAFQVPGKLIELPVKKGQVVNQGDLIGRLDPRDYKSNLQSAQAEYDKALANFKRGDELVEKGFISRTDYDRLRARRDVTAAELDKAKKALDDTSLKAPFGGVVAQRFVENFTEVRAKQKIISLQDTSLLELVVYVPEHIVAVMRQEGPRGTVVYAEFNAFPGEQFPLTIKEYSTQADAKTQTFEYVLTMPRPEGRNILPGMTANVRVMGTEMDESQVPASFTIPAIAVFADEKEQSHVWVINPSDNTAHARQVTTGQLSGSDQIEILEGLATGDVIAIAGVGQIREGMQVRPVERIDY